MYDDSSPARNRGVRDLADFPEAPERDPIEHRLLGTPALFEKRRAHRRLQKAGAIALTLILCGASSSAITRVNIMIAAFATQ